VFQSEVGAQALYDWMVYSAQNDPDFSDYKQLSVSTVGDETAAFVSRDSIDGYSVEYYVIFARVGNVYFDVLVGGLADFTSLSDGVGFASQMAENVTGRHVQTAQVETEHESLDIESVGQAIPLFAQGLSKKLDAHIATQLDLH
jgi:hypothetical protein